MKLYFKFIKNKFFNDIFIAVITGITIGIFVAFFYTFPIFYKDSTRSFFLALLGFSIVSIPLSIILSLFPSLAIYILLPKFFKNSWFFCFLIPALLFMMLGTGITIFHDGMSDLTIFNYEIIKNRHFIWENLILYFFQQYEFGIYGGFGGILFLFFKKLQINKYKKYKKDKYTLSKK